MNNAIAPAVIAACAALLVAGIGLGGAVAGAALHKAREHQHWLRDQRLRASIEFITALRRLLNEYRRHGEEGMDAAERADLRSSMRTARSAIEILCSPAAVTAAKVVNDTLYETRPGEAAEQTAAAEAAFRSLVLTLRSEVNAEPARGKGRKRFPQCSRTS